MKLADISIYDPEATRKRAWNSAIAEGRAARYVGIRLKDCPPFRDSDMAVSWRMGWRHADEEINARRAIGWR